MLSMVDKISGAYLVIHQPSAHAGAQPPYFYTLQLPGEKKASFSLTTPFVPRGGRENLSAFAVVNSDPGPDYGKFTVLQLQRSTNVAGPSQVASNFEANPTVALSLSLLRQGGSDVVLGNLLTLPVGGGLLYVQPVYVRATANAAAYPLLQKVWFHSERRLDLMTPLKVHWIKYSAATPELRQ